MVKLENFRRKKKNIELGEFERWVWPDFYRGMGDWFGDEEEWGWPLDLGFIDGGGCLWCDPCDLGLANGKWDPCVCDLGFIFLKIILFHFINWIFN